MSQEDRIQEALKALAAEDAAKQASRETEASVLAEFRRLQSEKMAEAVHEPQAPAHWYRPAFWALAGAAAMLAIMLAWQGSAPGPDTPGPQTRGPQMETHAAIPGDVANAEVTSRDPETNLDLAVTGSPQEPRERAVVPLPSAPRKNAVRQRGGQGIQAVPAALTTGPQELTPGPQALTAGPPIADTLVPPSPDAGASASGEPLTMLPGTGEVATDFFPLLEVIPPFERGRILRTTVPAATMREVGLWVHPDRLFEPVEADVLVGNDGIARAIRFVGHVPGSDSANPLPAGLQPADLQVDRQ